MKKNTKVFILTKKHTYTHTSFNFIKKSLNKLNKKIKINKMRQEK